MHRGTSAHPGPASAGPDWGGRGTMSRAWTASPVDDSKWQAMDWGDLEYLTGESIQVPQVDCAEDMSMSTLLCLGT